MIPLKFLVREIPQRQALVGRLVLACWAIQIFTSLLSLTNFLATICAWLVIVFAWPILGSSAKKQAIVLSGVGLLCLALALMRGADPDIYSLFSSNLALLAMLSAVTFLALANVEQSDEILPRGEKGFWSTFASAHFLGAVINLSVVLVIGDRLQRAGKLSDEQTMLLIRFYCAAAFWSPFFIASGVALTYAPGSQWLDIALPGFLLVLPVLLLSRWQMRGPDLNQYQGFPLQRNSLFMPMTLALAVVVGHAYFDKVSMLTLISCLAPMAAISFARRPRRTKLKSFVDERLGNLSSQYVVFLAAGLFSGGISALLSTFAVSELINTTEFSQLHFAVASLCMLLIGVLGIHPVISIALASPILLEMNAEAAQMAFLFLSVWGTATACSPLSGIGLTMVGRYQVPPKKIIRLQLPFLLTMWLSAIAMNGWFFSN
ncbi:hypothetical protein DBZ36_14580 [Alginatibacterium sediminis]|uniref:Uncharacterized protein n=1 Tax=Alginatibacterium sediminis TaxID=2164068 RepID=A0A420E8A1_9ALTE|nr:hypothetical protein [Alginatibacterium sediminis]RKF15610.1 hypothetical protein DBZ36_14580 [Alginatibacterium sediminis]